MSFLKAGDKSIVEDVWIPTVCQMCYNNCSVRVRRVNGTVVKFESDPNNPHNFGKVCGKGHAGIMSIYDPDRVKAPLKRTNPEKGIGVDPKWVEISWEEALNTVAQKMKEIRATDPRGLIVTSFDLAGSFFPVKVFMPAFGSRNFTPWSADFYCGNNTHFITYLCHGAFFCEPDLKYCNYLILLGTQYGHMVMSCVIHATNEMANARMRGMKLVVVDPVCTNAASKADLWIPIRPGTDAAFCLSVVNLLVNDLGMYDAEYLKKHTNGPYLVGPDGYFVRDKSGKPLVWDLKDSKPKPYDDPTVGDYAIEGEYTVDGVRCSPGFQLLKEHVKKYTPEMASKITTVPAETIRTVAREWGEAARIGSKIVIDGKELPYRPVALFWDRGPGQHKHAALTGLAIALMNVVVGAVDVPGGILGQNPTGPWWSSKEGPDGIITPAELWVAEVAPSYPARKAKPPDTLDLFGLFPVATYSAVWMIEALLNPEKYKVPYKPQMMLHVRNNPMVSGADPVRTAEALKKIPFMVSITARITETAELADVILPDVHWLERLQPCTNSIAHFINGGLGYWYWVFSQPVVKPISKYTHWFEIMMDIAERAGFISDIYRMANVIYNLKEPHKLDPNGKYSWADICDKQVKSWFGAEHDLEWFKKHGYIVHSKKKVEEAYQTPFIKARVPIYQDHIKRAGEDVKKVTDELGIPWDVSDYIPLPEHKSCPGHEDKPPGYDLYPVNYKIPEHTLSGAQTGANPWLKEMLLRHPYAPYVMINSETAKSKGIKTGDKIVIESKYGARVKGAARVTECVHPEVLGISGSFGRWAKGSPTALGFGTSWNSLLPLIPETLEYLNCAVDACIPCKVTKE